MAEIKFTREEKDLIVQKVKMYFREELDQEIGQFDAEFLLDFFTEEIGPHFFNKGLADAKTIIDQHVLNIEDALYEIEMAVPK
ncbi:DUF2164 domain-containing protein [Litoribrevibacter euphylliae]|uniref:DUF2164 domain-containing protein n=1 Tax=Litoribrevibacter euphylliae TaxID=1834034 RepID=A0ABV7HDC1_9GAMM